MFHQNRPDTTFFSLLLLGSFALFSACASTPKPVDGGYLTEDDFVKGNWKLPRGDIKNSQRELTLLVHVDEDGAKQTDLCQYVQTELGRISRFKIYIAWGGGGIKLARELEDLGEAAQLIRTKPTFDLALSLSIMRRTQQTDTKGGNRLYSFNTAITCSLGDTRTGNQVFARVFNGEKNYRETVMGLRGRVGGFDIKSKRDVDTAIYESAITALRDIVSQLGNEYPVVARVTSATKGRIGIDKGTNMGLFGAENFIVLEEVGTNLYVPFIKACAETIRKEDGTLQILAFHTGDGDADSIIERFLEDPANYVERHGGALLAVTKGLGVPETWDAAYKTVMGTQKR